MYINISEAGELLGTTPDLGNAGKENQDISVGLGQGPAHGGGRRLVGAALGIAGQVADVYRVAATGAGHQRRIAEQPCHRLGVEGRRHDQQAQVLSQPMAGVVAQRQSQVGVEAALVELIEDHQADAAQLRIGLQSAGKNPLGHHLDAGALRDSPVVTDSVTYRLSHRFVELAGHEAGGVGCSQPARLEHEDRLPGQPRFVEQRQGHTRRLAGTGRGLHDSGRLGFKGLPQAGKNAVDRKSVCHLSSLIHMCIRASPYSASHRKNLRSLTCSFTPRGVSMDPFKVCHVTAQAAPCRPRPKRRLL